MFNIVLVCALPTGHVYLSSTNEGTRTINYKRDPYTDLKLMFPVLNPLTNVKLWVSGIILSVLYSFILLVSYPVLAGLYKPMENIANKTLRSVYNFIFDMNSVEVTTTNNTNTDEKYLRLQKFVGSILIIIISLSYKAMFINPQISNIYLNYYYTQRINSLDPSLLGTYYQNEFWQVSGFLFDITRVRGINLISTIIIGASLMMTRHTIRVVSSIFSIEKILESQSTNLNNPNNPNNPQTAPKPPGLFSKESYNKVFSAKNVHIILNLLTVGRWFWLVIISIAVLMCLDLWLVIRSSKHYIINNINKSINNYNKLKTSGLNKIVDAELSSYLKNYNSWLTSKTVHYFRTGLLLLVMFVALTILPFLKVTEGSQVNLMGLWLLLSLLLSTLSILSNRNHLTYQIKSNIIEDMLFKNQSFVTPRQPMQLNSLGLVEIVRPNKKVAKITLKNKIYQIIGKESQLNDLAITLLGHSGRNTITWHDRNGNNYINPDPMSSWKYVSLCSGLPKFCYNNLFYHLRDVLNFDLDSGGNYVTDDLPNGNHASYMKILSLDQLREHDKEYIHYDFGRNFNTLPLTDRIYVDLTMQLIHLRRGKGAIANGPIRLCGILVIYNYTDNITPNSTQQKLWFLLEKFVQTNPDLIIVVLSSKYVLDLNTKYEVINLNPNMGAKNIC